MISWNKYEANSFEDWAAELPMPSKEQQIEILKYALKVAEKQEKYLACATILKEIQALEGL